MRVKEAMSHPAITVPPDLPVKQVAAILVEKRISAVPVVDAEGTLVGIVSEADLVPLETELDPRSHILPIPHHEGPMPHTAADVMTRDVVCISEEADVAEAARLMLQRHVKRLPAVAGGRVVGIISRRDVLKVLARSDAEIAMESRELLDDEMFMLKRFRADVEGGIVTLYGPKDPAARRLAELLTRSVPGVIQVRFADEEAARIA